MTKILVLGSMGMLGHMVLKVLSKEGPFDVDGTHYNYGDDLFYFDAEKDFDKLRFICDERNGYDYLINCIGITNDKIDEKKSASVTRGIMINAVFPHKLAEYAASVGTTVIHISTDGVFSGGSSEPYLEDALHDCTDIYGKTKSLGEVNNSNILNIRCSIIGPNTKGKQGLLSWFLDQPLGAKVHGYTDHMWSGVTTFQFAQLCRQMILRDVFDLIRREAPVHHFCPNQAVSKYDLLQLFKNVFRNDISVEPSKTPGVPVTRILDTQYHSFKSIFGQDNPMKNAIDELAAEMKGENIKRKI